MIDLDRMEEQLDRALTVPVARPHAHPGTASSPPRFTVPRAGRAPAPAPTPAPAPAAAPPRRAPLARRSPVAPPAPPRPAPRPAAAGDVAELLALGRMEDVDAAIRATVDRRNLVTWTTMRALLDGRRDDVRTGLDDLLGLARATEDPDTWAGYWAQRFWAAFEWGDETERLDMLDHCRSRAYRFDDLEWWGRLTLLLAAMGKGDEAVRAFDDARDLLERAVADARRLDALTDLVDAAAVLGDWPRVALLARSVPEGGLVVVGPGVVCKGALDRYRALGFLATGDAARAARAFDTAVATHRAIGAGPLLARTLAQAGRVPVAA